MTVAIYLPLVLRVNPVHVAILSISEPTTADNTFTVRWSSCGSACDAYVLQEATEATFAVVTGEWMTEATTQTIRRPNAHGIRYYRVQPISSTSAGTWSKPVSVTLKLNYFEDFEAPAPGWPVHTPRCCLQECDDGGLREHIDYKYALFFQDGRYHVFIPTDCRVGGEHGDTRHIYPLTLAPGIRRPTERTCIGAAGSFENCDPWWSWWGVAFAVSDDTRTVYSLEVNNLGDWGIVRRLGYIYPGPNHPFINEVREYIAGYSASQHYPALPAPEVNSLRVCVEGDQATFYINGVQVFAYRHSDFLTMRLVGIIGGDWEVTPTQIGYDYFYVDEGGDTYAEPLP